MLHDYLLCVTWHRVVYYMVAGYRVHGPLLWGLSVGIMDCSIHWMAVETATAASYILILVSNPHCPSERNTVDRKREIRLSHR